MGNSAFLDNKIDLQRYCENLKATDIDGLFTTENVTEQKISYPQEGNELYRSLEDDSFWFQHRNHCILKTIQNFPPDGPVWDIGGGNGFITKFLTDNEIPTILLEPGSQGAIHASQRGIKNIINARVEDIQFKENSLAAVGMFDVLEHIEDDAEIIQKLHHILQRNGKIYITVPAFQTLWSASDNFAVHHRRYNLSQLSKLFSDKFEIDYLSYFFYPLIIPIALFRSLPYRLGLSSLLSDKNEHGTKQSFVTKLLIKMLNRELGKLVKKKIKFGTSCILVARKK